MVMDKSNLLTEIVTKENIKIIDLMVLEHTVGRMDRIFMKDNLKMEWGMGKVNGHPERLSIQETMLKAWNKDMASSIIQAAIFIKEILLKIKDKDMVKCFGQMDPFIKEIGKLEYKMEKGICT